MKKRIWVKSSYSGGSDGNCVEVAGHGSRVLVRDAKDRSGPMLGFSPAAWRRFAGLVKRPLALAGPVRPGREGHSPVRGCPSALPGGVPRGPGRPGPGYRRGGALLSVCAGVGAVCESAVARGARPRAGGRAGGGLLQHRNVVLDSVKIYR